MPTIISTETDYVALEDKGMFELPHVFDNEDHFKIYARKHRLVNWISKRSNITRRRLDAIDHRGELIDDNNPTPTLMTPTQLRAAQRKAYAATHGPKVIEREYELGEQKITLRKGEIVMLLIDNAAYNATPDRLAPWQVTFKVFMPDQPKPRSRTLELDDLFTRVVPMIQTEATA
jgi:hypothetical protein